MKCEEYCQQLLKDHLPTIDPFGQGVCIEVGVGTFAFYCVLFAQLGYKTIAIEPIVDNRLREICQQYSINLLENCLSEIDGEQTLYIGNFRGNKNTNLSSLVPNWWGASSEKITVSSLTVKTLISKFNLTKITCLKIDVEGAEVIILRQLKNLSNSLLPEVIMFEYGGGDSKDSGNKGWSPEFFAQTNECLSILKECGYKQAIIVDESDVKNPINFNLENQQNNNFENLFKSNSQWGNILVFKNALITSKFQSTQDLESTGETKVIDNFIKNNYCVFDVGANVGNWSKTVLSKFENIDLHIFEPVPNNYKQLTENIASQSDKNNIHLNQIAISNHEQTQTFYYYQQQSAWSTFFRRFDVEKQYNLQPPLELPVITKTLDKYCKEQNIKRINFLKIDVEGGELDVLHGAKNLLEKGKIDYLQFEYGGTFQDSKTTLKEVFKYLQNNRYFLIKIEENNLIYLPEFLPQYENYQYSNYLAVNERLKSLILGQQPQMLPIEKLCTENAIQPRGVIHIGAHEGKELNNYLQMGIEKILFIEANPEVFIKLQENIVNYPQIQAVCCAISNENGEMTLHVTSMDQSSSILPLKNIAEIYPSITETKEIKVPCKTLDSLLEESNLNPADFNLLNIDIQRAELLAFQGAVNTLKYIEAINTEVNYEELYAGCALIDELDDFLETNDFIRIATTTPYHPSWGDAFYIKKPIITMSTLGKNGRFANQIFQYNFLKIYAKEHDLRVETPTWIGQTLFGHNDPHISKQLPELRETTNIIEQGAIIPNTDEIFKNVDFWGYFQYNTRYYAPHKDYFRSLCEPIPEIKATVELGLKKLRQKGKTIIGIHLRQ